MESHQIAFLDIKGAPANPDTQAYCQSLLLS